MRLQRVEQECIYKESPLSAYELSEHSNQFWTIQIRGTKSEQNTGHNHTFEITSFFSCKKNKRACGQSTNVKFSSFHQTLKRSSSVNSFWNRSVVVQSFRLHQAEWQLETVGEKLSTDGGGDPNGNTIACQDNKWPKTLSRQRIQDWRTMSVHMVILSSI